MDEISRELPPDTTTGRVVTDRAKGPDELVLADRGVVRDDLVVNRMPPSGNEPSPADGGEPVARILPLPVAPASAVPADAAFEVPAVADGETATAAAAEAPVTLGLAASGEELEAGAMAAAAAEAEEVAAIEAELAEDEAGLPPVPELADPVEVARLVYVLMLSSRESLSLLRLAQAVNTTQKVVEEALQLLQQQLQGLGLPVELARTGDTVKWISGIAAFPYLQRLRGVKKMERLSPAALETLAVIAYRQPVMRSEIEAIRGVKAGPMLRTLMQHKLVKMVGRAEVPGRPLQYGTTPQFLERFGIASLQELPSMREWKTLG